MIDIFLIFSSFILITSNIEFLIPEIEFSNSVSTSLINGNIFIIYKLGIYICDENLKNIIKQIITFSSDDQLTKDDLKYIKITRPVNDIFICSIKQYIYIFDLQGNFKSRYTLLNNDGGGVPTAYGLFGVTYYSNNEGYYLYYISFASNSKLFLREYKYIPSYNRTEVQKYNFGGIDICLQQSSCVTKNIKDDLVNCQLMKNSYGNNIYVCFYIILDGSNEYFGIGHYGEDGGTFKRTETKNVELNDVVNIKSTISPDLTEAFICIIFSSGENNCFNYNIINQFNSFEVNYYDCSNNICQTNYNSLKVEYNPTKEEYIFGCLGNNLNITTCIFNEDYTYNEFINKYESEYEIDSYSYIYNQDKDLYYLILSESSYIGKDLNLNPTTYLEQEEASIEEELEVEKETEEEIDEEKEKVYEKEMEEEIEEEIEKELEEKIEEECPLKKCKTCNEESIHKNLCIECNLEEGYYPLKLENSYQNEEINYKECYTNITKPSKFYLNLNNKDFEKCYKSCETCEIKGDENNNNCITCEIGYERNLLTNNCEIQCDKYYYIYFGEKRCTKKYECPEDNPLLISEIKKCTDNCLNEVPYINQYDGRCLKECPENSTLVNHICRDNNTEECILTKKKLILSNGTITNDLIDKLEKTYTLEYNYTNNHVTIFENELYSIIFYKNEKCITNLSLEFSEIDFGSCYSNVQTYYSITDKLVMGLIYIKFNNNININYPQLDSFYIYEPNKGNKLNVTDLCYNESILVQENIISKLSKDKNPIFLSKLINQDINVFDLEDKFYTDICYKYIPPTDKDISLKDRLLIFYPNITLCKENCDIRGVNPDTMRAKCECKFNDILNNNLLGKNKWYKNQIEEIVEIFSGTNLVLLKCYKEIFNKNIIKKYGFYITLGVIIIQVISTIFYFTKSMFKIKKYIFYITEKYTSYIINHKNNPPQKNLRKSRKCSTKQVDRNKINNNDNINIYINNDFSSGFNHNYSNDLIGPNNIKKINYNMKGTSFDENKSIINAFKLNGNFEINMENYIQTEIDDLEFDDILTKDKRKFCQYLFYRIKANLLIIDIFFNSQNQIKPRIIKILLLVLNLDVYLIIITFFFNEDLISEIYNSKNDNQFSFAIRTLNRIFYIIIAIFTYNNIIDCFFIDEKKIKSIFRRQKGNIIIMKNDSYQVMKTIIKRYVVFIIVSFIISIFTFYYISCFNGVYSLTEMEWIKSSVFTILIYGIILLLIIFFETCFRYLAIKTKSEKLFKLSVFLAEINDK